MKLLPGATGFNPLSGQQAALVEFTAICHHAARAIDGPVPVAFVDHHDLAAAITDLTDAQVLTAEQLRTPLSQVDLSALDPHEHDQIDYWKPTTVGELLFNFWD